MGGRQSRVEVEIEMMFVFTGAGSGDRPDWRDRAMISPPEHPPVHD
jgi:hypothetical protein